MVKPTNSPKLNSQVNSTVAQSTSVTPTNNSASATANATPTFDSGLEAWILNVRHVLHFPVTILSVAGLLVAGAFAETAPRKSLDFLDNILGRSLFFIFPFLIAILTDWSTGLLAGVVSLIIFARLQKQDSSEGFSDTSDGTDNSTKLISNSHRWFIERVLGESPVAISSDRITTSASKGSDVRSSSSTLSIESNLHERSSSSSYK
jgi:hypothetical protein